jgi:hypothetical protein
MDSVYGVAADVYVAGPMELMDGVGPSVKFRVYEGLVDGFDEAYWDLSIYITESPRATGRWYEEDREPGALKITSKWFEIDEQGDRTIHYRVENNTPALGGVRTFTKFIRTLVRIPARTDRPSVVRQASRAEMVDMEKTHVMHDRHGTIVGLSRRGGDLPVAARGLYVAEVDLPREMEDLDVADLAQIHRVDAVSGQLVGREAE